MNRRLNYVLKRVLAYVSDWSPGLVDANGLSLRVSNTESVLYGGVDEYIDYGTSAYDFERTDEFSFSFWFWASNANAFREVFSKRQVTVDTGWGIQLQDDGTLEFQLSAANGWPTDGVFLFGSGTRLDNSAWHHVVITYDGSSLNSGVVVTVDDASYTMTPGGDDTLSSTTIGTGPCTQGSTSAASQFFGGTIDEMQLFSEVLTADQKTALFNQEDPTVVSSNCIGWYRNGDLDDAAGADGMKNRASGAANPGTLTNGAAIQTFAP